MTQQAVGYEDCDIPLGSGRLRVWRWGAAAVVCVPGLSANLCGFDRLAERLAGGARQPVAIDLRGRGRSEVTGAGTYGWRNHARDVLGIANAVGASSFAIIGQSSGAAIAMTCAQLEPSRVERLVLVDLAGSPDQRAAVPVLASVRQARRGVPVRAGGHRPDQADRHRSAVGRVLGSLLHLRAARRRRRRDAGQRPRRGAGGSRVRQCDVLAGPGCADPRAVGRDQVAEIPAGAPGLPGKLVRAVAGYASASLVQMPTTAGSG